MRSDFMRFDPFFCKGHQASFIFNVFQVVLNFSCWLCNAVFECLTRFLYFPVKIDED